MNAILTPLQIANNIRDLSGQLSNAGKVCERLHKQSASWLADGVNPGDVADWCNQTLDTLSDGSGSGLVEEIIDMLQAISYTYKVNGVVAGNLKLLSGVDVTNDFTGGTGLLKPVEDIVKQESQQVRNPYYGLIEDDIIEISSAEDSTNDGLYRVKYANPYILQEYLSEEEFDSGSVWTVGTNWNISSGYAEHTSGSTDILEQTGDVWEITPTDGDQYYITFEVSNRTAGSVTAEFIGATSDSAVISTNTQGALFGVADPTPANNKVRFTPTSDFDGRIEYARCTGIMLAIKNASFPATNSEDSTLAITLVKRP